MTPIPNHSPVDLGTLRKRVLEDELTFSFARSSGPGGQNVNKVSTRVTLLFDVGCSDSLSSREKTLLRMRLRTRITTQGVLRVVSSKYRTQSANRRATVRRFYELVAEALHRPAARLPSKPSLASQRRRVEEKRKRSRQKQQRGRPRLDDDT
ncbi:MAG: aminoacyl-tRNA hydrolase [Phycisphaerales bacterium]|nr:MAG: aminoacyl-tRNA hydrolase [Phycisphaerales bacterium]